MCVLFFFFSSRRRHTRFDCDWSSDVCSSDLARSIRYRVKAPDALARYIAEKGSITTDGDSLTVNAVDGAVRSEEHTSELQSQSNLVCRLLLEKKKTENRP